MKEGQPDPFVMVPRYVIREAPDCIAVYTATRLYANWETGECWPSLDRIASDLSVSVSTVQRKLNRLAAIGALTKRRTGRANLYRFPPNRIVKADQSEESPVTDQIVQDEPTNIEPETENQQREVAPLRERDLLWEVFCEVHGDPATGSERGKYNKAMRILREAEVSPSEYPLLVRAFTTKHGGLQPAPMTVATRVGEMRHFTNRGPVVGMDMETAERNARFARLEKEQAEDHTVRLTDRRERRS